MPFLLKLWNNRLAILSGIAALIVGIYVGYFIGHWAGADDQKDKFHVEQLENKAKAGEDRKDVEKYVKVLPSTELDSVLDAHGWLRK